MPAKVAAALVLGLLVVASAATAALVSPRSASAAAVRVTAPLRTPPAPHLGTPARAATPAPAPEPELGLEDSASILEDAHTGAIVYQHNAAVRRAPASLTKIMTVLVALDHAPLTQLVTVPAGATTFGPDYSTMGLSAGDQVTVRELLYGVFLASANDAAETLAQTLVPRDQFIAEMNAKAAALGLGGTHFVNPTGVDAAGHYSTAADLARLTRAFEAAHGDLLAIAEQPSVVLYATDGHPEYDLVNLNKLITWPYDGATGLKTGYTERAGGCVAATASRGGRDLVAVVLGDDVMFTDAAKLFDYGWSR